MWGQELEWSLGPASMAPSPSGTQGSRCIAHAQTQGPEATGISGREDKPGDGTASWGQAAAGPGGRSANPRPLSQTEPSSVDPGARALAFTLQLGAGGSRGHRAASGGLEGGGHKSQGPTGDPMGTE